jgi:DNA-binding GntR family transcriptional regulator
MVKLQKVSESFSLKDHVYRVLRDAIVDLNIYDDGTDLRLDERELADQLAISRTPIREALVRLESEGFVEIQPRKGVFVLRKSRDEILEMIMVWAALESMAARLAAPRATPADIQELRDLAAAHAETKEDDLETYSGANIRFHQRILEMSGCSLLRKTADALFLHIHSVRRRAIGEGDRREQSVVDHNRIIEAIESREATQAAEEVRMHSMRLYRHIESTWLDTATQSQETG